MEELLSLKWNNHRSTFLHSVTILRNKPQYSDVTLACDGRFYSGHKLVLSTCSDYFSAMFDRTASCKNPIIVLKDVKCEDLEALLDYMYLGEVNVRQADLASLIKAAECLRVKGLAVPDDEPPKSQSDNSVKRHDGASSPPAKRKRRNEDQDGRDDVRPSGRSSPLVSRQSPQSHSRLSPPLDNESGRSSPLLSDNNQNNLTQAGQDGQEIKVEKDDTSASILDESYELTNDTFKEEPTSDPGGELTNDLPEFLQSSSASSYSHSFAGPSFQPDMQNWQGDQVLGSNYSGIGFGPSQGQDGSQNSQNSGKKDDRNEKQSPVGQLQASDHSTPSTSTGIKIQDKISGLDQQTPPKIGLSQGKYKISSKTKPQKDKKVSPLVLSKVQEKGGSLGEYINVSELVNSIVDILGALNIKLMEELLVMGFPCAICKGNEIFANLEDHLVNDHDMSPKVAEEYVDLLMNKISQMFGDLKDKSRSLHIKTESSSEPEITPVEKKRSREIIIDKLPLADHIFLMKYQMFLENEFSHHAAVTARIYMRAASEIILFLRQNGIALSEAPIKSQQDMMAITSLLSKFCASRSIYSKKTLSVKMQYFSFFMKHFYQKFYNTDAALMKLFKKQLCKICTELMNERASIISPDSSPRKVGRPLSRIAKTSSKFNGNEAPQIKTEEPENKDLYSFDDDNDDDEIEKQPSTSKIPKKKGRPKGKKSSLRFSIKSKGVADKMGKPTGGPLFKNPTYRKCLSLLAHDTPSSLNACKARNALLFTMSYKHKLPHSSICHMTLGDFRSPEWCMKKHAYLIYLNSSPKDESMYLGKNMMKYIKTWIEKYRGFLSMDDSDDAPVFVNENGSKLSENLVSVSNRMFAKSCGIKPTAKKVKKLTETILPDINANPSKLEVKLEDCMSKSPQKFEGGPSKKSDVLSSYVFYSGQNPAKARNNNDPTT